VYYIYHIPNQKIGVTRNIYNRVTVEQGFKPGEYEVLDQSEDIDYISKREIELQKLYGYKLDRQLYKSLFNKMKINPTEQTSTFPVPLNKLKGHLMDNIGLKWETPQGYKFEITTDNASWIANNAKVSMYNTERCYIYNKALAMWEAINYDATNYNLVRDSSNENHDSIANYYDLIRKWASDKGIYEKGDSKTQYIKLMEEAGELAEALLKKRPDEIKDAIGDMVVVLTNLAHLEGFMIEDCISSAYEVIAKRTGKMINGTFVKEATLKDVL
jgi:NTP pyrophosphatase (non-canonical NTP hydrolase)